MKIWTWLEMRTKIEQDLDTQEEQFIASSELIGYANSAIDTCEQLFMSIRDSYFETETYLPLINGIQTYSLPSDIYGTKLTLVQYNDGSVRYPIKKLKDKRKIAYIRAEEDYRYRLVNDAINGLKLKLYPASRETSSTNVTLHYIRSANRIVDDTTNIDMPEASNFIIQFIKDKVKEKERGTVGQEPSDALKIERDLMISALADMVEDEDNKMEVDLSWYYDHR